MSDLLQEQDAAICSTVQRNLASRGARRGCYVPAREGGVHHFHRLLADFAAG
jgi:choline monooxygenase